MIKNSGKLKKGKPIVFKDGKKVDMSSVNDQWIDGDILTEEMRYISKMTEKKATKKKATKKATKKKAVKKTISKKKKKRTSKEKKNEKNRCCKK